MVRGKGLGGMPMDCTNRQDVRLEALPHGFRVIIRSGQTCAEFVTDLPFSLPLLRALAEFHGQDAFSRIENPLRYASLVEMLQRRHISLRGTSVLDVGCRYGTSSLAASRLGASLVVGVDIDLHCLDLARRIVHELDVHPGLRGGADLDFLLVSPNAQMPFAHSTFDIVLCNALFEHIAPALRPALVRELWSLTRPGGYLIVHETPNRWWPRDGHTTGLWLVPLLPKSPVQSLAGLFCRRFTRDQILDWDFMIAQGIRGVTYGEIAEHAPGHDLTLDLEADDIKAYFDDMLRFWHSPWNRVVNRAFRWTCRGLEWIICKPRKLPNTSVTPSLSMALRKT